MPKQKNDTQSKSPKLLVFAFLAASLICFVTSKIILPVFMSDGNYYEPAQILELCNKLNIALDHTFCSDTEHRDHTSLEELLLEQYPVQTTSFSDWSSNPNFVLRYGSPSCNEQRNVPDNLCPSPSDCSGDYSCYVDTANIRIHIGFNENGNVRGYYVPASDS